MTAPWSDDEVRNHANCIDDACRCYDVRERCICDEPDEDHHELGGEA